MELEMLYNAIMEERERAFARVPLREARTVARAEQRAAPQPTPVARPRWFHRGATQ